jgi:predicted PurR-regulated permease PerM
MAERTWFRRFAKLWGFALFVVLLAWLFRAVLLPFVFAVVVAYILAPAVNRLARVRVGAHTMPRGLAVIICYVVLLSAIGLFFAAFLPRLSGDVARLGREGPRLWAKVNDEWTPTAARWLEKRFPSLAQDKTLPEAPMVDAIPGEPPPPPGTVFVLTPLPSGDHAVTLVGQGVELERADEHRVILRPREEAKPRKLEDVLRARLVKLVAGLESQAGDLIRVGQSIVTGLVSFVMHLFLVLVVAAFMLIDLHRLHAFARGLIPAKYRGEYDVIVAGIDRGMSGVIRGQLLICLINAVLTYVGLLIFDVKYAFLLAVVAGVMSLIPIFGSILSTIPIVAMALVSSEAGVDVLRGVFMLLWILGIHFIEANFLNPKIMGTAAKMHPVVVIFALIAGESTYGLVGALFAVPVASIIQTLFVYFRSKAWRTESGSTGSFGSIPPGATPPAGTAPPVPPMSPPVT